MRYSSAKSYVQRSWRYLVAQIAKSRKEVPISEFRAFSTCRSDKSSYRVPFFSSPATLQMFPLLRKKSARCAEKSSHDFSCGKANAPSLTLQSWKDSIVFIHLYTFVYHSFLVDGWCLAPRCTNQILAAPSRHTKLSNIRFSARDSCFESLHHTINEFRSL